MVLVSLLRVRRLVSLVLWSLVLLIWLLVRLVPLLLVLLLLLRLSYEMFYNHMDLGISLLVRRS